MIADLFAKLSDIVDSFTNFLRNLFAAAMSLFYSGEEITPIGILMLLALGTGLLIWGFNFIRSLIRVRRG